MSTILRRASLLILAALLTAPTLAAAQGGQLDPSFGTGGIVTTDFGDQINSNVASADAVALQTDGKILVVGGVPASNGFPAAAVVRYNTDGSVDTSFGVAGIATTSLIGSFSAVAVQSDGKIVATGPFSLDITVARFTSSGALDPTFGTAGIFTSGLNFNVGGSSTVAIQSDGKILVGNGVLLRLLTDGQIDSSFGTAGFADVVSHSTTSIALLSSGKILVGSAASLVSRYTSTGSLDTTFGINGQLASAGPANGLLLLTSGEFIVGGSLTVNLTGPTTGFAVSRYQGVGISDPKFAVHGGTVTAIPGYSTVATAGLGMQSSGDIVALGTATKNFTTNAFALARYTPAGKLDVTFGNNGTVITMFGTTSLSASSIAIQSDGKIIAVGSFTTTVLHGQFDTGFKIARYLGN